MTGPVVERRCAPPRLSSRRHHQAAREWNDTRSQYPRAVLAELLAEPVRQRPDAAACAFGPRVLTYGELGRRSRHLARRLRELGAGPDVLVGIAVERSLEMVVGAAGIVTAGAAYLPLDPDYPEERLRLMLEDGGVTTVLVAGEASPALAAAAADRGATVIDLLEPVPQRPESSGPDSAPATALDAETEPPAALGPAPEAAPEAVPKAASGAAPANLAYVTYTSGSTGRPKGVAIPQSAVVRLLFATAYVPLGSDRRVGQASTLSFDAATFEIWGALLHGATLVGIDREVALDPDRLAAALARLRVTTLFLTTSLFNQLVAAAAERPGALAGLDDLLFGGEACDPARVREALSGPRRLLHVYGPTESTTFATWHRVRAVPPEATTVSIGRPLANTTLYVVDRRLAPVAAGEPGELLIGGDGLARGYWRRPALTAERFVPDPLGGRPGSRLYRTGDRVRLDPDGGVEFVGRSDHQVKVRGFRIELGEIESRLSRHPGVAAQVVVAREEPAGRRLVAYAVPRPGQAPSPGELRHHLAAELPEYMLPSALILLPELPLTPGGKVDRSALPAPQRARPGGEAPYRAPRTRTEAALAAIWADILGLERVGVDDDLFALGGHSLVVGRIASRVRRELGRELSLLAIFEHPTVAALAERLDEHDPGEAVAADLPPIERLPAAGPRPVSLPQERIWFLLQLSPTWIAYDFQFTSRFPAAPGGERTPGRAGLDPVLLERANSEIVRRHEVLRTTFPEVDGRPVQVIHEPWPVSVPRIDLTALPAGERLAEARTRVRQQIRRGFDITTLPLIRPLLFVLAPDNHLFLQVEQHFVHDGWSLAVYLEELLALYRAYAADRPSPLPELAVQYADYAAWQRGWLDGRAYRCQLAYWRRKLAGPVAVLELPADRPRPRAHSFAGGALRVDMDSELYAAARRFSREQGMTLFMTMLATFYALLHRYTGEPDLVVGSGLANRRHREVEKLVGMVVNTVVLRTRAEAAASFRELLERVRVTTLEAHLHQDMPFERLVRILQPERDLSRNPLFQILFSFHDAAVPDLEIPEHGITGELFEWHNGSAKSDLNVVVKPVAEQRVGRTPTGGELLTMIWEYSADILDRSTVVRMWHHYRVLLQSAIEDPSRRLADLALLTPTEAAQLRSWGASPAAAPDSEPVPFLVARQARLRPHAPAVVAGGETLTYGALAESAADLARRLRELPEWGGPETVVALVTGRCAGTAVAALGVMAAGGAYLPIDPAYPNERIAYLLADSRAAAVVTTRELRGRVPEPAPPVLALAAGGGESEDAGGLDALLATAAGGAPLPQSLAYVIYTSGSTGAPKGVELTHRGLANLVAWHRERYRVDPEDRATLIAGPGFDAAVWELWPYLAGGAALHIPGEALRTAPGELLAWLAGEGITLAFLATPLAEAVLDICRAEGPPPDLRLRALLTGGDRLLQAPPAELPFAVVNHYGPTESTVVTTAGVVDPDEPTPPPIGRPVAGLAARVLDRRLRPVPAAVPGELCVGGRGLARGYRHRPGWTAAAFVPDPSRDAEAGTPGAGDRLYRSGDLVRHLPDGRLEFLGRIDDQIQVRGFRVEPGEIEAALEERPEVERAVVLARAPEGGGESRLVAYVAAAGDGLADPEVLRRDLARRLPEYMVPQLFVPVPEIPLTANGKLDRRALAASSPDPDPGTGKARPGAPGDPLQELVAGIWAQVLGRERVGLDDDFFELGGHSLLATRVISRLREATGAEVPLAALFEARTAAGLAAAVEATRRGQGAVPPDPIPRSGGARAPLSFAQERLWFLDRLAPGSAAYVIARSYRIGAESSAAEAAGGGAGAFDPAALAAALTRVVRRHEVLRTHYVSDGETPEQVVEPPRPMALPVADLGHLATADADREARRLAREHPRRRFDLAAGPVLRSALLRLGAGEHRWLLACHHIAFDGGSMELFQRELAAFYAARVRGSDGDLPAPPPVQYGDYARWQRGRLREAELEQLLAYWRRHLAGAPALLELPTDRPRPAVQRYRGAGVDRPLPPELGDRIDALARASGATRFMVLLTAFGALAGRYAGVADAVVGTPVAGRVRSDLEPLIGLFVNTLPLRLALPRGAGFRDLLVAARKATLDGHAHRELPFEKLVEELQPERNLSHSPLFQVLLTVGEEVEGVPRLPGTEIRRLPLERRESRFDLELLVAGGGDGPVLHLRYDRDLFDRDTAARMAGHLERLLSAAVEAPETPWDELPLLSPAERNQALVAGIGPPLAADAPPPGIYREVELQCSRTPEAEALVWAAGGGTDTASLTYRELAEASTRLARHLVRRGAGPEVPVAVLLDRSPDLVVTLLAILQTGAAYLPLDPAYPAERLAFLLEDARAPLVVSRGELARRLPRNPPTVLLDAEEGEIAACSARPLDPPLDPEGLAYVIYTSGSTGRPKGVAIPHRAAQALLAWARGVFGPRELAGVFAPTSVCFDLSVFELFVPLTAGGRVILADDALALATHPARDRVTLVNTVPSAMAELVADDARAGLPPSVVTVNLAGEPLRRELADRINERGVERVYDLYGPSEDTTYSTFARRRPGGAEVIGSPVAGTRAHLLDPRGAPVPPGVPGEIHLGGAGLARGYLRRPGPTAAAFVPDPLGRGGGAEPGDRLYKTGDLARRLPGGDLQFLGRLDHQVKVRGFRIELGEIEAALAEQDEIREAVVLAPAGPSGEPGDRRLVAYAVAAAEGGADPETARRALADRLPGHMIPVVIVLLETLPRLPNGKIDRRALGRVEAEIVRSAYVAPGSEVEEALVAIWQEVLGVDRIGIRDDFFRLGGHSLLATRVLARVLGRLGADLPLRALFQNPTIGGLAGEVEAARRAGNGSERTAIGRIRRARRRRPVESV